MSLSSILEAQNVNSIETINTNFIDIVTSYFLIPMKLSLLKCTNFSLSWLSCYRGFYISVSLKVIFKNVYFGHFINITGPYFIQFMKITGEFTFMVFEEIYGAILGEALYSRTSNSRIANISNNNFFNCSCKTGGSLCIINFNKVYINNLFFENSYAIQKGGSFAVISVFQISIINVKANNSKSLFGAVGFFLNIDNLTLLNTVFQNSFGVLTGCFEARNTHKMIDSVSINSFASESGGFLSVELGKKITLMNLTFLNVSSQGKEGSIIVLEYFISNVQISHQFIG